MEYFSLPYDLTFEPKNGATGLVRPHSGIIAFSASGQNGLLSFYTIQEDNFCAKCQYTNAWMLDENSTTKSHRIYYNDIDIASGDFLCDGKVVGNVSRRDLRMVKAEKIIICGNIFPAGCYS